MGKSKEQRKKKCGIIMPLAVQKFGAFEYSEDYWSSLLRFLKDAIRAAGYEAVPVWEDAVNATITKRIVKNIESVDLSICVVSSFNPNVMIELGMRLFANKPVLVLIDENTSVAPFDIKDLEYYKIPSRPLYSQYSEIKKKISEFLKKMSMEEYKNFKDNFSSDNPTSVLGSNVDKKMLEVSDVAGPLNSDLSGLMNSRHPDGYLGPKYCGPTGPAPIFGTNSVDLSTVGWRDGALPEGEEAKK